MSLTQVRTPIAFVKLRGPTTDFPSTELILNKGHKMAYVWTGAFLTNLKSTLLYLIRPKDFFSFSP